MIYGLSLLIFNHAPQWPKFHPTSMTVPHLTAFESANVERLEPMIHTGTHIDAPFYLFPDAETVDFAAFSMLIQSAGRTWARAVAWDQGEMA